MVNKILFFIVIIHVSFFVSMTLADITPLKKPIQTKEETQKKLLKDVLKPIPKPTEIIETKQVEKKIVLKEEKKNKVILPKKKPIIAGAQKTTNVKISKYFNKKDFSLAKKAIEEMKKSKWSSALKIANKSTDKSIYNFIQWRHLLTKGNQSTYYDY